MLTKQTKKRHAVFAALALLVLLAIGAFLLWRSGFFTSVSSLETLQAYIERCAPYTHLCFFLIQLFAVIVAPIPSNVVAAAGGILFGTWTAFLLTYSAVFCGSLLTFSLARTLGRDFVDRVVSRKLSEKYIDVINAKAGTFLTLAFLFPCFPDDLLCILAGLTSLSRRHFILILLLARPWGLLFANALGGSSLSLPPWALAIIVVACLLAFFFGMKYGDKVEQYILDRLRDRKKN